MNLTFPTSFLFLTLLIASPCSAGFIYAIPVAVAAAFQSAVGGAAAIAGAATAQVLSFLGIGSSAIWFGATTVCLQTLIINGGASLLGLTGVIGLAAAVPLKLEEAKKEALAQASKASAISVAQVAMSSQISASRVSAASVASLSAKTSASAAVDAHRASADAQFKAEQEAAKNAPTRTGDDRVFTWVPREATPVLGEDYVNVPVLTRRAGITKKAIVPEAAQTSRTVEAKDAAKSKESKSKPKRPRRARTRRNPPAPSGSWAPEVPGKIHRYFPPAAPGIKQEDLNKCYNAVYDMADKKIPYTIDVPKERSVRVDGVPPPCMALADVIGKQVGYPNLKPFRVDADSLQWDGVTKVETDYITEFFAGKKP